VLSFGEDLYTRAGATSVVSGRPGGEDCAVWESDGRDRGSASRSSRALADRRPRRRLRRQPVTTDRPSISGRTTRPSSSAHVGARKQNPWQVSWSTQLRGGGVASRAQPAARIPRYP